MRLHTGAAVPAGTIREFALEVDWDIKKIYIYIYFFAALGIQSELRSCVKVEVAVLGSRP